MCESGIKFSSALKADAGRSGAGQGFAVATEHNQISLWRQCFWHRLLQNLSLYNPM